MHAQHGMAACVQSCCGHLDVQLDPTCSLKVEHGVGSFIACHKSGACKYMHVQSRVQAAHPPADAGPERTVNRHMALAQAECIQHGLRTLAFCKTRKLCELVTAYTRESLRVTAPHLTQSIAVYRAGYSPAVRLSALTWLHTLLGLLAGPSGPCLVSHAGVRCAQRRPHSLLSDVPVPVCSRGPCVSKAILDGLSLHWTVADRHATSRHAIVPLRCLLQAISC